MPSKILLDITSFQFCRTLQVYLSSVERFYFQVFSVHLCLLFKMHRFSMYCGPTKILCFFLFPVHFLLIPSCANSTNMSNAPPTLFLNIDLENFNEMKWLVSMIYEMKSFYCLSSWFRTGHNSVNICLKEYGNILKMFALLIAVKTPLVLENTC